MSCVRSLTVGGSLAAARNGLAFQAFATAVLLFRPAVCGAEESGPSIEEMWAKIEVRLGAPVRGNGPATKGAPAAAPAEEAGGRADEKGGEAAAEKPHLDMTPLLKKLERRAGERLDLLMRERRHWDVAQVYLRVEAFKMAVPLLFQMLNTRRSGLAAWRDSQMDLCGGFEAEYARAMAYLGNDRAAEQYVAKSEGKLDKALLIADVTRRPAAWFVKELKAKHAFARNYPEAREKAARLISSLAENPDADGQWELVELCDPQKNKAALQIKWFVAVHEMRAWYPGHPANQDGRSDQQLACAYMAHELYEECIAHLEAIRQKGGSQTGYTPKGQATWDLATSYDQLARLQELLRDRRVLANYPKALDLYKGYQKQFPDAWQCRPRGLQGENPSLVDELISQTRAAIGRLAGGR